MKIIIATDGSEYSTAAVEECCSFFGTDADTEIKVIAVYEPMQPIATEPFALSAEYYDEITAASRNEAEHFAAEAVNLIRDRCPGVTVSSETLAGKPAHQIVEYAENWPADLVVVGSHGRGFWGRLLGSVSNSVVTHAPCTVMVVRRS
ncbi:MAG TPA: universal stress protein [Pyrinomonadaceae bacterium]|nr:universal stress protein [Pyrinomonadaceae bacterium]